MAIDMTTFDASAKQKPSGLHRMHILLTVQTLVIILLSVNRLSTLTLGYK